jgi:hypothetical protein
MATENPSSGLVVLGTREFIESLSPFLSGSTLGPGFVGKPGKRYKGIITL